MDFVIDFDDVWKWLGFANKANAKCVLEKNFIEKCDYTNLALETSRAMSEPKKHGGQNKQIIMLNIQTFKSLCLKATYTPEVTNLTCSADSINFNSTGLPFLF